MEEIDENENMRGKEVRVGEVAVEEEGQRTMVLL